MLFQSLLSNALYLSVDECNDEDYEIGEDDVDDEPV